MWKLLLVMSRSQLWLYSDFNFSHFILKKICWIECFEFPNAKDGSGIQEFFVLWCALGFACPDHQLMFWPIAHSFSYFICLSEFFTLIYVATDRSSSCCVSTCWNCSCWCRWTTAPFHRSSTSTPSWANCTRSCHSWSAAATFLKGAILRARLACSSYLSVLTTSLFVYGMHFWDTCKRIVNIVISVMAGAGSSLSRPMFSIFLLEWNHGLFWILAEPHAVTKGLVLFQMDRSIIFLHLVKHEKEMYLCNTVIVA